jgi:hypothetical protein
MPQVCMAVLLQQLIRAAVELMSTSHSMQVRPGTHASLGLDNKHAAVL